MLLPDERGPQQVVDAAVEDDDVVLAHALAVHDPGDVGAGGADEEPAGLEQDAGRRGRRVAGQASGQRRQPAGEEAQVQRLVVGLVRDAEPTTRVHQPEREARRGREVAACLDRGLDVRGQGAGIEQVRRPEGMEAQRLEPR